MSMFSNMNWGALVRYFKLKRMEPIFKVVVARDESESDWTLSDFYFNGEPKGVGVEDEKRDIKVHGETRIDNGIYKMSMRVSPKFSKEYYRDSEGNLLRAKYRKTDEQKARYHVQHELLWVLDVPKFDYILWHWGNLDDNTDGCYCVGTAKCVFGNQKGVTASRNKYEEIYPELWRAVMKGNVTVEYKDKSQIT